MGGRWVLAPTCPPDFGLLWVASGDPDWPTMYGTVWPGSAVAPSKAPGYNAREAALLAEEISEAWLTKVHSFRGIVAQFDDITLMVVAPHAGPDTG
jgi:hypothetical protein